MVSILLSFPVPQAVPYVICLSRLDSGSGNCRWNGSPCYGRHQSKQIFLLCGNWYSKGCVVGLADDYLNLSIICKARVDTAMYGLPPERTEKRGHPKKYVERLPPEDFMFEFPKTGEWNTDARLVFARLWDERVVMPLSHSPKAEMKAADSSSPKIRKTFFWITPDVSYKILVDINAPADPVHDF